MDNNDFDMRYARAVGRSQAALETIALRCESAHKHFYPDYPHLLDNALNEIAEFAREQLTMVNEYVGE